MKYAFTIFFMFATVFLSGREYQSQVRDTVNQEVYQLRHQVYGEFDSIDLPSYHFPGNALAVFQNGYIINRFEFLYNFRLTPRKDTSTAAKTAFLNAYILSHQRVAEAMEQDLDTTTAFRFQVLMYKQFHLTPYLNQGLTRAQAEGIPEFQYDLRHYYDSLITFELINRRIWAKANLDNSAQRKFYNEHLALYQGQSFEISRTKVIYDYQQQLSKELDEKVAQKFPYRINTELLAEL